MSNIILNEGYNLTKSYLSSGKEDKILVGKNRLIDLSNCSGSLILGHNHIVIKKAIKKYLSKNFTTTSFPNIHALKFSKVIKSHFPNFKKIVFCNTGSEAVIKSLRISRAINKKSKIATVVGSWHGSVNETLFFQDRGKITKPISSGLKANDAKNILYLPYNDITNSRKILDQNKKKINCILIEPILGGLPLENVKSYLKFLEIYAKKNNINLILDEIVTGFRCKNFSVQNQFRIKPNLTLIGKICGGGFPIGIIGISDNTLKKINKLNRRIFFGGTFSGNAFSTHLGLEVINFLKRKNIIKNLIDKSVYFQNRINSFIKENRVKAKVYRFDSILRIIFSDSNIENRIQRDFLEKKNLYKIKKFRNFLLKKKNFISI